MDCYRKEIATLVRTARIAKQLTQAELATLTGLSLRSVQRIERGEVVARAYTLRALAKVLEIELPAHLLPLEKEIPLGAPTNGRGGAAGAPRSLFIALLVGICIFLFAAAFLIQSPRFPETDFEMVMYWALIFSGYLLFLTRLWYGRQGSTST